jgi:hypothetical protein
MSETRQPPAPAFRDNPHDEPERDSAGNLTRAGMEAVLRGGGTVLHKGRVIGRVEALPSAADLAAGDAEATRKALEGLATQRAALDEQEKKLHAENGRIAQARSEAQEREQRRAAAAEGDDPGDDKSRRKAKKGGE